MVKMRVILKCKVCDKDIGYIDDPITMRDNYIEISPTGTLFVDGDINIGAEIFFNCVGCRNKIPKNLRPGLLPNASLVMTGDFIKSELLDPDDGYTSKW
jgi:hypothetical protein